MQHNLLHAHHAAAGARLLPPDAPSPLLTYGDVPAEYAAATGSAVLFDETDRGLVVARGAEAPAFLHRLLANDVRAVEPGRGVANLLLTPKGKVRFAFDLARRDDRFELSTPAGQGAALRDALEMYHFTEDVELEDATDRHAPLGLVGPRAAALLREVLGGEPPTEDHALVALKLAGAPVTVQALPLFGSPGFRVDAGPERAAALWEALVAAGARPAGRIVADSLRVEAGAALPGEDVDDTVYPQEARLERSFSLDKGCYIGQEVVAKIDTYGGLNKRLVALELSHDDPVPRGTRLYRQTEPEGEWRDLGVVTSWAYSFVRDTGLALGFVKRRHQAVGTRFRVGEGESEATATVVALPVRAGAIAPTGEFE